MYRSMDHSRTTTSAQTNGVAGCNELVETVTIPTSTPGAAVPKTPISVPGLMVQRPSCPWIAGDIHLGGRDY